MTEIQENTAQAGMIYASPWQRVLAYLLDVTVLFCVLIAMQVIIWFLGKGFPYTLFSTGIHIELWVFASISLPAWLYFTLNERSARQATFGKRLFHLQVAHVSGSRIGFWRALLRTVVKLLPWELTHVTLLIPVPMWWNPSPVFGLG